MQDVAIVGAGDLGGALADVLAREDVVRSIRLIDEVGRVAEGKALDIAQSGSVEEFATLLSGSTDVISAAGAAVIVIADRARGGEWQGDDALLLLRRIVEIAPRSIVLCAGASQRELIERGVRELGVPRSRLFGSAPEALASGARALVALDSDVSPRDVVLSVLGIAPGHLVIAWEHATLAGFALTRLVDEPSRQRIASRIAALWPPGPYALAAAARQTIESLVGQSRRLACCFVAPDDVSGRRVRTAALPVRLGSTGIVEVVRPPLSVAEQVALDNAMLL